MKTRIVMALLLALTASASHAQQAPQSQAVMPAGALQQGTYTSEQLRSDTMVAAIASAAMGGCKNPQDVQGMTPFVSKPMQGEPLARQWSEIWVFTCTEVSPEVRIDFQETADGGADYSIKTMKPRKAN